MKTAETKQSQDHLTRAEGENVNEINARILEPTSKGPAYTDPKAPTEWRDVPGFEGLYQANRAGGLRSALRRGGRRNQEDRGTVELTGKINAEGERIYWMGSRKDPDTGKPRARVRISQTELAAAVFDGAPMPTTREAEQKRAGRRVVPGYGGRYDVTKEGEVRSLKGQKRAPVILKGILTKSGQRRVFLIQKFANGGSLRRSWTPEEVIELAWGDRESALLLRRQRESAAAAQAPVATATAPSDSIPVAERDEIILKWERRHLRRYPTVTVEILADCYVRPIEVILAVVEGVA